MSEFNSDDRRRRVGQDQHALKVVAFPELFVVCSCGERLGGRRFADKREVTMSDLLGLVRLHSRM